MLIFGTAAWKVSYHKKISLQPGHKLLFEGSLNKYPNSKKHNKNKSLSWKPDLNIPKYRFTWQVALYLTIQKLPRR